MKLRAYQIAALGQSCLGIGILACTMLMPHYFFSSNQGGISNFGTEDSTRDLFVFGFATAAVCMMLASLKYKGSSKNDILLKAGVAVLSTMYVLVLFSTFSYKLSDKNEFLHHLAALALFIIMAIYVCWLRFVTIHDLSVNIAFIFFCISVLLAIGTLLTIWHLLFTAQILGGVSFSYILLRSLKLLDSNV